MEKNENWEKELEKKRVEDELFGDNDDDDLSELEETELGNKFTASPQSSSTAAPKVPNTGDGGGSDKVLQQTEIPKKKKNSKKTVKIALSSAYIEDSDDESPAASRVKDVSSSGEDIDDDASDYVDKIEKKKSKNVVPKGYKIPKKVKATTSLKEEDVRRRKRKRKGIEDGDALDNETVQEEIHPTLAQFDDAVRSLKPTRRKTDLDEDTELDQIISRLCHDMRNAAANDVESNESRKPATAKLKLLPRVKELLEKSYLYEQLLDHETVECIRYWLEPLPDGSLPSINIRNFLFDVLSKLPLDSDQIRESRIGRVVMFYFKCDHEIPQIRKKAANLIQSWSMPLLKARSKPSRNDPMA